MNRLGLARSATRWRSARRAGSEPGFATALLMSHFVCIGDGRRIRSTPARSSIRGSPRRVSRRAREPRPIRPASSSARRAAPRPRAARLCALRRQPLPSRDEPDARRWYGWRAGSLQVRDRRSTARRSAISARWTARGRRRPGDRRHRLCRWLSRRGCSRSDDKPGGEVDRRRACAAPSPAGSRWTLIVRRHHRMHPPGAAHARGAGRAARTTRSPSTNSAAAAGTIGYEILTALGRRHSSPQIIGGLNGEARADLRLPELRRGLWALAGPLRSLRRVEHHRRGSGHPRRARRRACARPARQGPGRSSSRASPGDERGPTRCPRASPSSTG